MEQKEGEQRPMSPTRAATRVQAAYRSYVQRREYKRQQEALHKIQTAARSWLQRKRAAALLQREASEARFRAVMQRHTQRIQQLEAQKQQLQQLPLQHLEGWQQKRHSAAARIQAHWRGSQQRKLLRQQHPDMGCALTRCDSPDLPLEAPADQQRHQQQPAAKVAAAGSVTALPEPAWGGCGASASLTASSSQWRVAPGQLVALGRRSMTDARRAQLLRQVQQRVDARRAAGGGHHTRPAAAAGAVGGGGGGGASKLPQLLAAHAATEEQRTQATAQRQLLLQRTELLCAQLQQLPPLGSMPESAQPRHFPLPPQEGGRLAAARQAHALALAEAKVSSRWWLPLKQLCEAEQRLAQQGKGGTWPEHWAAQAAAWQQAWARLRSQQQQQQQQQQQHMAEVVAAPPGGDAGAAAGGPGGEEVAAS